MKFFTKFKPIATQASRLLKNVFKEDASVVTSVTDLKLVPEKKKENETQIINSLYYGVPIQDFHPSPK